MKEPRAGLDRISVREAMLLWGDLVEALHGVNGYGGTVAELYAYRFGGHGPHLDVCGLRADYARRCGDALGALLDAFIDEHGGCVKIAIDGKPHRRGARPAPFDHRVHVSVEAKP